FPVNLYGPNDNFDLETSHVIPAMIRKIDQAITRDEPEVELWGDGSPTREFLYVDDCAEALLFAAERYDQSEPMNLGSGHEISIRDLATTIADLMGYHGKFRYDTSKPNGQPRRGLDVSRAKRTLGWTARTRLQDGLRQTIDWWRSEGRKS